MKWINSGRVGWTAGIYRVGVSSPFAFVSGDTLPANVAPGATATVSARLRLPDEPRLYRDVRFRFARTDGTAQGLIGTSNPQEIQVRLAGNSTQDGATLTAIQFPSRVYYTIEDDVRSGRVSVRNTGSRAWAANSGFRIRVTGPAGQPSNPVLTTIGQNETEELTVHFRCSGTGSKAFHFRMESPEGQPFGNTLTKAIICQRTSGGHQPDN